MAGARLGLGEKVQGEARRGAGAGAGEPATGQRETRAKGHDGGQEYGVEEECF